MGRKTITGMMLTVLMLTLVACNQGNKTDDENQSDENSKTNFEPTNLVGTWNADFEETWKISRDKFLKDTIRGENAYPKDEAEREEIIRKEIEPIFSAMRLEFRSDGKFISKMGGESTGTYKAKKSDAKTFKITVEFDPNKRSKPGSKPRELLIDIEFKDRDTITMLNEGVTFVLRRSKS